MGRARSRIIGCVSSKAGPLWLGRGSDEAGLADSFYRAVFRITGKNHILCSPCSLEALPSPNEAPVPPEKSPKYSVPREAFV